MIRHLEAPLVRRGRMTGIALIALGAGALGLPFTPQAQETPPLAMADLEQAFWVCDYTVTTQRVDVSTGVICVAISDELKQRKFDGDFDALLAWWRINKDVAYRDLAVAEKRATGATMGDPADRMPADLDATMRRRWQD